MPTFQLLSAPRNMSQEYAAANEALQLVDLYAAIKDNPDTLFVRSIIDDETGKSLE